MSQSEEPRSKLPPEARIEIIKRGLLEGWAQDEVAEKCGVCRETINRDIRKWKLTGGWDDWIRVEFSEMHEQAKQEDFMGSYKEIAKLAARTMTQRTEARVEGFELRLRWTPGDEEEEEPAA